MADRTNQVVEQSGSGYVVVVARGFRRGRVGVEGVLVGWGLRGLEGGLGSFGTYQA